MTLQVLVAAAGADWEPDLVRLLDRPGSGVVVIRRCVDVADAVATAASGQADAAVLAARLPGLDSDAVDRLVHAGAEPVVVARPGDADDAQRAARWGVATIAPESFEYLATTVANARTERRTANQPAGAPSEPAVDTFAAATAAEPGHVLAVWGPTGAPGRSTVALGIAAGLAALGARTLVVDADVYGGAIGQMLAMLDEVSGVLAAARAASDGRLDPAALAPHVRQIGPRLGVLTGVPRPDRWPQLRPGALTGVLAAARESAAFVVIDCGFCLEQDEELSFDTAAPRRNGATVSALERADTVLAVGSGEPLGLARLARGVVDLAEAVPGVDVRLVVNRVRTGLGWSQDEMADTLFRFTGATPITFLPDDRPAVDRAWVAGRTLAEAAPDSPLRKALQILARDVAGVPAAPDRRRFRRRRAG
ncbi:MAG: AAA family ATPase [Nocardioidaceae bacterium]